MARKSAMESIFFQFDSELGKGMQECFEKAMLYVNSIDYSGVVESKWVGHRYTLTHAYAKSTLFPSLKKTIEKTINLTVTQFVDVRYFSGIFAIDISLDKVEDTLDILARQTGEHTGRPPELDESATELADTYKLVDERTSKLTGKVYGKGKRPIEVTMYMDVDMALLMLDNIPKTSGIEPLTARELTGIYLHEVGHLFTMLEQSCNMYQTFDLQKKHLESIARIKQQNLDLPKMVNVYTKKIRPMLVDKVKKHQLNKKFLEASDALKSATEYVIHTDSSDYIYGTFEFLTNILINFWWTIGLIYLRLLEYFLVYGLLRFLITVFADKPGEFGKSTEQSLSNSVYYHAERMADEFATRHGYGSDLASALTKLTQYGNTILTTTYITGGTVSAGSLRDSKVYALYLKGLAFILRVFRLDLGSFGSDFSGPNNYEDDIDRLKRILQDQKAVFKQSMPSDMAGHYLAEMDKIKKSIEEIKKPWLIRVSDALWKYVLDYPMVLKRIFQLDDMEEMEQHLKKVRSLIDNELYASAAAFKVLAK